MDYEKKWGKALTQLRGEIWQNRKCRMVLTANLKPAYKGNARSREHATAFTSHHEIPLVVVDREKFLRRKHDIAFRWLSPNDC